MAYRRTGGFGQEPPVVPASIPLPTTETNPWKTLVIVSLVGAALWWLIGETMKESPRVRV